MLPVYSLLTNLQMAFLILTEELISTKSSYLSSIHKLRLHAVVVIIGFLAKMHDKTSSGSHKRWLTRDGLTLMWFSPQSFAALTFIFDKICHSLTKISIRAKRSISRVFSLFIVPGPFSVHCPYKSRINRAESVSPGLKPY